MLKKVLLALAAVVAVLAVVIALQPADYQVVRAAVVNAPPARVFGIVNDLHRWNEWGPWSKLDPAMKTTFAGPAKGVGASQSWSGSNKVGEGTMTLTASKPNELVEFRLDFLRPMKDTGTAAFAFKPEGKGTAVTWTMSGKKNFIAKGMCLVVSMDRMIGPDFERGLANLKALAEGPAKK